MLTVHTVQPPSRYTHNKLSVYNLTVLTKIWNVTVVGTGRNGRILKNDLYAALQKHIPNWNETIWTRVSIGEYMSTSCFVPARYFYLMVKEKSNNKNVEYYNLPLEIDQDTMRKYFYCDKNPSLCYNKEEKSWYSGCRYIGNEKLTDELEKLRKALAYIDIFYVFVKLRFLYQNIDCHTDIIFHSIQHYLEYFGPELLQFKFA